MKLIALILLLGPALASDIPQCSAMQPRPGGAPGWMAWGPVVDGQHQNLLGIPADWDDARARAELESYGYCTSTPAPVSPLERNHQRLTQPQGPDSGIAGLAVLGIALGALWASRDDDAPMADYRPRPIHQPHQAAQLAPVASLPIPTPSAMPSISPVVSPLESPVATMPRPVLVSPDVPPVDVPPVDVSVTMAERLRPTLITANPRQGKGVLISYAWRRAKALGASIWLIQPKAHPAEVGYWEGVDERLMFMAENYLMASDSQCSKLCQQMVDFIHRWRSSGQRPTILIIDELSLLKAIFPQWYQSGLVPQLLTEMSSGETDHRALWAVTQSPLAKDIGLSGGNRAPFDLVAIEGKTTEEHLRSITRSYAGVPMPHDDSLYAQSESPKKTIIYHSALGDWAPMPRYEPWEPALNVQPQVQTAEPGRTLATGQGSEVHPEVLNLNVQPEPAPLRLSEPEPELIHQVLRMRTEGMTQEAIIEALWGAKKGGGVAYRNARDEYQFILEAYGE